MLNYNKFNGHKENFSKLIRSGAFVLLASSSLSLLASPTSAFAQAQTSAEQAPAEIQPDNRVNINTADAETLALALDGIGRQRLRKSLCTVSKTVISRLLMSCRMFAELAKLHLSGIEAEFL